MRERCPRDYVLLFAMDRRGCFGWSSWSGDEVVLTMHHGPLWCIDKVDWLDYRLEYVVADLWALNFTHRHGRWLRRPRVRK